LVSSGIWHLAHVKMAMLLASLKALLGLAPAGNDWGSGVGIGWQQMGGLPPWQPHTGSIAVPLSDGSMLLLAGQAGLHGGGTLDCFNCTSEVWRLDPPKVAWTDLSQEVPWDPRWGHSVAVMPDDTVWMMFGCCERGKPTVMFRDVWTYNPVKGMPWTRIDTVPPFEGIQATSIAIRGNKIWVVGGWSQSRGTLSQVAVMDTDSLKWKQKSEHGAVPWDSRADHASAISPDGLWLVIFGGQHASDGGSRWTRLKDTWRVPLPGGRHSEWEQLGDLSGARSSPCTMVLSTGWLITFGGHWTPETELLEATQSDVEGMKKHHEKTEFKIYKDVLAFDLRGVGEKAKEWKVLETKAAWPARDDAAAAVTSDGTIIMFGGGTMYGGGGYHQDVWKLENASQKFGLSREAHEEL